MTAPVLDRSVIARLRQLNEPGEPDVVHEVLTLFLAEGPARLAAIGQALDAGDTVALQRAAHALKGSAAAIGAAALREICSEVEDAARRGEMAVARVRVESMRPAYTRLRAEIDGLL